MGPNCAPPFGTALGVGLVGLLPGELRQLAAEVAVAGGFLVDRPTQVQRLDDALRRQLEVLADQVDQLVVGDALGDRAVRVDPDVERVGIADGVGELHLALLGQAGGDDVLGDVAGHVGGRAIDLGRVLAAEGAAAVPAAAAVGIHDDLAAGQAAVAVRAAHLRKLPVGLMWQRMAVSASRSAPGPADTGTRFALEQVGPLGLQASAGSACR